MSLLCRRNFIKWNIYILTTCIVSLTDGFSITISIRCTCTTCMVSFTDYSISITIIVGCTCTCLIIRIVHYVLVVVSYKSFYLISLLCKRNFINQNISIRTTFCVFSRTSTDFVISCQFVTIGVFCAFTCSIVRIIYYVIIFLYCIKLPLFVKEIS